jgi:asparagine synthase (glutamine-hydrolysing)
MQLAKENGIKVVLDGQGGDELFAGYRNYYPYFWNELLLNKKYIDFFREVNSEDGNIGLLAKTFLKNNVVEKLPLKFRSGFYKIYNEKLAFLNRDFFMAYRHRLQPEPQVNILNRALCDDFLLKRLKIFLKCEDRCSMWHSVESRVPFTDDHRLAEYVFAIPSVYKIRKGVSKYLLRQAMKNFIPEKVYERKDKMGFNTPHNIWLKKIKDEVRPMFNQKLSNYIDVKKLDRHYKRFFSFTNKGDDKMVFRYITFAKWVEVFGL